MRVSDLIEEFIKDLFDENEYIEKRTPGLNCYVTDGCLLTRRRVGTLRGSEYGVNGNG